MTEVVQSLFGSQASDAVNKLSSTLGVDSSKGSDILSFVTPLVMGGLKKQKQGENGEQRLGEMLDQHSGGGLLDNLGSLFGGGNTQGDTGLGGILGSLGADAIVAQLAEKFGLSKEIAQKVVPMVSSLVLSALASKRDNDGGGLSGVSALLDRDGDGEILDDVAGLFAGGGSDKKDGSGLGGLVSGLFGGK